MDRVLRLLAGVQAQGSGFKALCPAHSDFRPSLAIDLGEGGGVLLKCHAGCRTPDILAALGLTWADLMGDGSAGKAARKRPPSNEEIEFRAGVYSALLAGLRLKPEHRKALLARGLSGEAIDDNLYRSVEFLTARKALRALREAHGERVYEVPGIADEGGEPRLVPAEGQLIPVRDLYGRVVAAQARVARPGKKYVWVSCRDAPSGSPCHAGKARPGDPEVWVTEGPLKADVASHLTGMPFLGVGGVAAWAGCLPLLAEIGPRRVVLAPDMDGPGRAVVREMAGACRSAGYEVHVAEWDGAKGIDDALLAGAEVRVTGAGG